MDYLILKLEATFMELGIHSVKFSQKKRYRLGLLGIFCKFTRDTERLAWASIAYFWLHS